jgi:mRNA interferase RelE/StbE
VSIYRVEFKRSAAREFRHLPKAVRSRIEDAVRLLAVSPYSEQLGVRKLRGAEDLYRIRVGDYRIVYEIHGAVLIVVVVKIGHRREVYRR